MSAFNQINDAVSKTVNAGIDTLASSVAQAQIQHAPFVRGFTDLCANGWQQGWHERNGGNLSYRLTPEEADTVRASLSDPSAPWVVLDFSEPTLAGEFFLVTGAGCYIQNIPNDPLSNIGIVEVNENGSAYRVVWGLAGRQPTSELPTHLMVHAIRSSATKGACRVIYHAHPRNVIAMTAVEPLDARTFTRALWKAMTECIIAFPEGVGVVPWMVPGGRTIAQASAEQMKHFAAVVWAQHGLFASGPTFDETFGLMQTIEKAADIYGRARMMNGGSNDFLNTISDEGLAQIADELGLDANRDFLDL
ncbi:rhamnulose-1-phosphate aldolase [Anaerotardibacter muris]|uniref:rhamnulose-1-phosphate aldolase n=1 Tax=Anaerotardibacter muris TaxID=2941505 RepID=UPI0020424311|nr:rhamnulose-1-phosphate aldolase [Anaerotardibacter muris]